MAKEKMVRITTWEEKEEHLQFAMDHLDRKRVKYMVKEQKSYKDGKTIIRYSVWTTPLPEEQ